ncbi:hypothetical protein FHG87_013663 [Trinorchestia longiramus]|nr:hypothetical protein FHG87_013663 [Trinorchestia longiramus]
MRWQQRCKCVDADIHHTLLTSAAATQLQQRVFCAAARSRDCCSCDPPTQCRDLSHSESDTLYCDSDSQSLSLSGTLTAVEQSNKRSR